jgi:hypothetical protein
MDHEFDKEIDTLLRKAHRGGPVLVGDIAGSRHLEADEISAFAENALPERSRAMYTAHIADCDRCRKILSHTLVLNSEAAPVAASSPSVITIAERAIPWYRQLFLFPNLAYVMGGLVLIFGSFLAFTIVRNSSVGDVAMAPESRSGTREAVVNDQYATSNSANTSANSMANVGGIPLASNSNSLSESEVVAGERGPLASEPRREDQNLALDGVDTLRAATQPSAAGAAAAPPPPPPTTTLAAPKDVADDVAKEKPEAKAQNAPYEPSKTDSAMMKQKQAPGSGQAQSGPMRNNENAYNRQLENLDRRRDADKKVARNAAEESASGRKVILGRTFERKDGVWYDTAYAGRPTINVRRGTAEFLKLPSGIRTIANSLSGTIVVVWGAKAYRIQ